MSSNVVIIPGDGYRLENHQGLINYLSSHGFNVQWIPLKESGPPVDYEDLEADNYCSYIDSMLPKSFYRFSMYGISKGSHHCKVYACKNPTRVKKLVLVEDTMMIPELMKQFELCRGNDFINDYYTDDSKLEREDNTKTDLDVVVSDKTKYVPKCKTIMVWTSRDNQNKPYDNHVQALKKKYVRYLKNNGCPLTVRYVDSDHCLDQHSKYYPLICSLLK